MSCFFALDGRMLGPIKPLLIPDWNPSRTRVTENDRDLPWEVFVDTCCFASTAVHSLSAELKASLEALDCLKVHTSQGDPSAPESQRDGLALDLGGWSDLTEGCQKMLVPLGEKKASTKIFEPNLK